MLPFSSLTFHLKPLLEPREFRTSESRAAAQGVCSTDPLTAGAENLYSDLGVSITTQALGGELIEN